MANIEKVCALWRELALATAEAWGNDMGDFSTSADDEKRWIAEARMETARKQLEALGEVEPEPS